MSLDVWLKVRDASVPSGSGIFVRRGGQTVEITREEWDRLHPEGHEPVRVADDEPSDEVYSGNITHNVAPMAHLANIYGPLWAPEEHGIKAARDLIGPLTRGLEVLRADPERFKALNPPNGWGSYEGFLSFVESYLEACKRWPDAEVRAWR